VRGQLTRVREYNGSTLYANTTYAYFSSGTGKVGRLSEIRMGTSNFDAPHRPTTATYPNDKVVTLTFDREGEHNLANNIGVIHMNARWYLPNMVQSPPNGRL
jgi:hypothetical protein